VTFHRPAAPGTLTGYGRVVSRDGTKAVLAARLSDGSGAEVASALAHARVVPPTPGA
jgi:acyl-coenzyme A thioesterase PaaI-like protein